MTDPSSAGREELIALVAQLQATVRQLEQRVRELEGGDGSPKGMPGHKPGPPVARVKQPRKKRRQNYARRRAAPTRRVTHAPATCPDCGAPLCGGAVKRTREVIEVPPAALAGLVLGRQRLGVGLVSLIATLREEARLPVRAIQWCLQTFHHLALSVGAIVGALRQVARRGQGLLAELRAQIRGSLWVHADETGWREDGQNGYVWTFCTPTVRYFGRGGRDGGVVDEVLGAAGGGVLVSDFYVAYHHYPGLASVSWTPGYWRRRFHERSP